MPLADDPNRSDWPDHILNSWYGGEFVHGLDMVITNRYKYIFNNFAWDELYDLQEDPGEIVNRVNDPGHAAIVDDMAPGYMNCWGIWDLLTASRTGTARRDICRAASGLIKTPDYPKRCRVPATFSWRIMNRRRFSQLMVGAAFGPALFTSDAQTAPSAPASSPKNRFSVMIWTLDRKGKGVPAEKAMEIVAEAGYQGVELTHEIKDWAKRGTTQQMKAKMRSLGLVCDSIAGLNIVLADPSYADKLQSQLEAHIQVAKDLECQQIIVTSGRRVEGLSREQQHQACIENLKHIADLMTKNNVELVIEPIDLTEQPTGYLNSVVEGFEIVRAVSCPNIKVLYDFYHEQYQAGNLIVKLEQNIDWIGLVHIADVPGRHEPGTGEIDYLNIYRKLAELNYRRFITMEYFPTGDPLESLKTARLVAQRAPGSSSGPYKLDVV